MMLPLTNSFIAVLIPTAMDSSLPLGSVPHATNTPARNAGNSRLLTMITITFAILTPLLLSLFSRHPLNPALIARFLYTRLMAATKCSALSASAFGLGTLASLKLAVTIHTTCNGCGILIQLACLAIPAMSCAGGKLILTSLQIFILSSKTPSHPAITLKNWHPY